jgi:hypothetical protein
MKDSVWQCVIRTGYTTIGVIEPLEVEDALARPKQLIRRQ